MLSGSWMGNEAVLGEWVSLSPCAHHSRTRGWYVRVLPRAAAFGPKE